MAIKAFAKMLEKMCVSNYAIIFTFLILFCLNVTKKILLCIANLKMC